MDFIIQKCRKGRGTRPRWLDIVYICCVTLTQYCTTSRLYCIILQVGYIWS